MKKFICFFIILVLSFSFLSVVAFAEENTLDQSVTDDFTSQTNEDVPVEDAGDTLDSTKGNIYDQVIAFVTDGAFWAKFGAILMGLLALIGVISTNLKKIKDSISVVFDYAKGLATKEETSNAVTSTTKILKKDFNEKYESLEKKYEELKEHNDTVTAILSIVACQLVKSPNARTEIMGLISSTKKINGDIASVVAAIEAEIKEADELTKPNTPALDSIVAEIEEEKDTTAINLG